MAWKVHGFSRMKWMCEYRIAFTLKYGRKAIYNQIRSDIGEIIRKPCGCKGIGIAEVHLMPNHVRVMLAILPKYSAASVTGYLKGGAR